MTDERRPDPPGTGQTPVEREAPRAIVDEQLSAWLDGELPAMEMELLVARFGRPADGESPELEARRRTIARYGLIGEVVRGGTPPHPGGMDVACRVREALGDGPDMAEDALPLAGASRAGAASRAGTFAGIPKGLAASLLAGVAVLGGFLAVQARKDPAVRVAPVATVAKSGRAPAGLSPDRLTNYLVYHGEYSGALATRVSDSHVVAVRGNAPGDLALETSTAVDAGR